MGHKLVIFDVDGTIVDSQAHILRAMGAAFGGLHIEPPDREAILSIVGLSLPVAFAKLVPDASDDLIDALARGYRDSFSTSRSRDAGARLSPLYPGAAEVLAALGARDDLVLGIATGKSRRGLAHLLDQHGFRDRFVTLQTADDHPSKPHPAMVLAAMAEAGVTPGQTMMIGDTSYDMEMACAAGATAIGVAWGYHPRDQLGKAGARRVLDAFADLHDAIDATWGAIA